MIINQQISDITIAYDPDRVQPILMIDQNGEYIDFHGNDEIIKLREFLNQLELEK